MTFILLMSAISFNIPISNAQDSTIAFALGQGQGDKLLTELKGNLTALGYTIATDITEITESALADVDVLVLGAVYGANFTQDEVSAIATWFNLGEKGLWVGGDSDYGGYTYINDNMNDVLAAVSSGMRIEPTSVEDPESNCASAYRVAGSVVNTEDSEVADIVSGVSLALFHGPSILYAIEDSTVSKLDSSVENVFWVMQTSGAGVVVDHDLIEPFAHENGEEGHLVLMGAEIYAGSGSNCKIIAAGASPYGDYQPICTDEYKGVTLQGMLLIVQSIEWLATVLAPAPAPLIPGFPIEAIIIGIAITTGALLIFRKKPSVPTY